MKKLMLLLVSALSMLAADSQIRIDSVNMDDRRANVQANGIRFTDTIDLNSQNMQVELRVETVQSKSSNRGLNVPSYASASLVVPDILKFHNFGLGAKLGYKQQFGPQGNNTALIVFHPQVTYKIDRLTLRGGYEFNNPFVSRANHVPGDFHAETMGADVAITKHVSLGTNYEIYRGYLKRNVWASGLTIAF